MVLMGSTLAANRAGSQEARAHSKRAKNGTITKSNPRKEIAKSQKIFFWDTGIRNALLGTFSTDEFRPDIGPLWENWVIAEVAKRNALLGAPAELFFWRSRGQSEVDLVVKQDGLLRAFEIKWSAQRVRGRAFRGAYGVNVEMICPDNPFVTDIFPEVPSHHK